MRIKSFKFQWPVVFVLLMIILAQLACMGGGGGGDAAEEEFGELTVDEQVAAYHATLTEELYWYEDNLDILGQPGYTDPTEEQCTFPEIEHTPPEPLDRQAREDDPEAQQLINQLEGVKRDLDAAGEVWQSHCDTWTNAIGADQQMRPLIQSANVGLDSVQSTLDRREADRQAEEEAGGAGGIM
ncbi:MAG: hypothetical protein GYB65_16365 [Chloroflexi bacterium]|nr:hypothetical protein [Chloroflexota bacterium]